MTVHTQHTRSHTHTIFKHFNFPNRLTDSNGCLFFFPGPHSSLYARFARQMDPSEREEPNGSLRLCRFDIFFFYRYNVLL